MCIAYLALGRHPDWPLFIAANRDEFHDRAALAAAPWPDHPDVVAGIDGVAKGTWLGVTRQGRYAFLTNYRDPAAYIADAPSRGQLVGNYLTGQAGPGDYARMVAATGNAYNGFNLVLGDGNACWYVGNRTPDPGPCALGPGNYVLSNHLLDTPWPKATRLRRAMDELPLGQLDRSLEPVFALLRDTTPADDTDLPDTGIPRDRERLLSSPFIVSEDYGTRCSTVVAIHASGRGFLGEISFDRHAGVTQRHDWPFTLDTGDRF